jgi:hypothetical protein
MGLQSCIVVVLFVDKEPTRVAFYADVPGT